MEQAVMTQDLAQTEITYGDHRFRIGHCNPQDHLFIHLNHHRIFYEVELLQALQGMLSPDDLVVDIGANIGNHALFFAGVCGARVLAIEPNPRAREVLRQNIEANRLEAQVIMRAEALGSTHGRARVFDAAERNMGMAEIHAAPDGEIILTTLDDIELPAPPRLLKIDAEGMEREILLGSLKTIEKHRPLICIESPDQDEYEEIFKILRRFDYLSVGVYNSTPTHVFQVVGPAQKDELLTDLSKQIGRLYIEVHRRNVQTRKTLSETINEAVKKQNREMNEKLAEMEKRFAARG